MPFGMGLDGAEVAGRTQCNRDLDQSVFRTIPIGLNGAVNIGIQQVVGIEVGAQVHDTTDHRDGLGIIFRGQACRCVLQDIPIADVDMESRRRWNIRLPLWREHECEIDARYLGLVDNGEKLTAHAGVQTVGRLDDRLDTVGAEGIAN